MGEAERLPLAVAGDVTLGMHRRARRNMTIEVVYDGPLVAPVAAGQEVGRLVVNIPEQEPQEFALVAAEAVERKGLMGRIGAALAHMIRGN
jgi:D-alanyl-D-alanine carboxypeptidase (penicillin-binding protein 5/6)